MILLVLLILLFYTGIYFGGTDFFKNSGITLSTHQLAVVNHINANRGLLCIHSVGSGKTLTAIACINSLRIKTIVITPKSLQDNFIKEIIKCGGKSILKYITFYTITEFTNKGGGCKDTLLIIDEAHNLRTKITGEKGKNAQALVKCARKAHKVLLLTATPIVNEIYDLANLISMIDGEKNVSENKFNELIQDPSYLKCKISFFTPDADFFNKYYPRVINKEIFLPMNKDYLEKYTKIESDLIRFDPKKDPTVFYNGVRRASNKIDNTMVSPKIKWVKQFFKVKNRGKCVIFTHFLENGINLITSILDKLKIPYAVINGTLSKQDRKLAVTNYNTKKIKVLLISKAGAEGLDLCETRYIIILEPSWNRAIIQQIIGRGVRFKSHYNLPEKQRKVSVYELFLHKKKEDPHKNYKKIIKLAQTEFPSIDLYLKSRSLAKQKAINEFLDKIKNCSIEVNDCNHK